MRSRKIAYFLSKSRKGVDAERKIFKKRIGKGHGAARQGYIDFAGRKRYTKLDILKWIIELVKG